MTDSDSDITSKAEQVLADAATLPSLAEVRDLAGRAVARGRTRDMTMDEIRALADHAIGQAEQVTVLLRRLSELLATAPPQGGEL